MIISCGACRRMLPGWKSAGGIYIAEVSDIKSGTDFAFAFGLKPHKPVASILRVGDLVQNDLILSSEME